MKKQTINLKKTAKFIDFLEIMIQVFAPMNLFEQYCNDFIQTSAQLFNLFRRWIQL